MRSRNAAILGVVAALAVGALALRQRSRPVETRAVETTRAIRIVRRDRTGLPERKATVRDPARVRALTEALGVDGHPSGSCPPDYADADIGIILSGNDVYARRNVYVFGAFVDAPDAGGDASSTSTSSTSISVVSVTSAGCRLGPPADSASLERELRTAHVLD